MDPATRRLPKLGLEIIAHSADANYPFYEFEATWDNPEGSVVAGHFSVNRATGEVWVPVACYRIKSKDLTRLQTIMRKRIGLTSSEYHRLRRVAPCVR
jgi:hypothetical protein